MSFRRDYEIKAGEKLIVDGECKHGPQTVSLPCDHEVFASGPEKPAFPDMPERTGCCGASLSAPGAAAGADTVTSDELAAMQQVVDDNIDAAAALK